MKIIVYPHELTIGGSQINAVDLAAKVRDLGHEVLIYAQPGELESYIQSKSLGYIPAYGLRYRPAPNRIAQLAALVRSEKIDLIHAYEWPPALDAFFGAGAFLKTPIVCTMLGMTMSAADPVPKSIPMILGTTELAEEARTLRYGPVFCIEPPIDTDHDNPRNDGRAFRERYRVMANEILVVTVSRLAVELKLDAIIDAIDAADLLAGTWPIRLVVVGDGPCAEQLRARSAAVNTRHRREVITMAGPALDPRGAYAAADIVVGMGSSALRGLAHGKALIVQGERGFNLPFDETTEGIFYRQGFYGAGDGTSGGRRMAEHLSLLFSEPSVRASRADRGRNVVLERFSLNAAASKLSQIYEASHRDALNIRTPWRDLIRSAWIAGKIEFTNHLPSHKNDRVSTMRERLQAASEPLAETDDA